jgi:hypothetical protein
LAQTLFTGIYPAFDAEANLNERFGLFSTVEIFQAVCFRRIGMIES